MIRKTISMPDEMGQWIAEQLAQGRYSNESEYIRDLIRRDRENQRKTDDLRSMLAVAEAQIEAGEFTELKSKEDIQRLFDEIDEEIARETGSDCSRTG
ncbi:type II toxin-antitoxin system ParD family antitoxin [Maricaulis sp.]|uniref:type II toxin-antitoxin system ParD family antitoxin n=1 Tax=Maricaulis sp. TaxID=1486257 RepID=UPI002625CB17|nr:type II toxin-antitoxin system ParD family antitoxin [Maricaulis sp.]